MPAASILMHMHMHMHLRVCMCVFACACGCRRTHSHACVSDGEMWQVCGTLTSSWATLWPHKRACHWCARHIVVPSQGCPQTQRCSGVELRASCGEGKRMGDGRSGGTGGGKKCFMFTRTDKRG